MGKVLTATAVLKFRAGPKRKEIPDAGCPGLHLVIQPSGAKSWALRYRRPDKRPAKLSLGPLLESCGTERDVTPIIGVPLTLLAARRLVATLRHEIAQGRDPGAVHLAERKRQQAITVERTKNTFAAAAVPEHFSPLCPPWCSSIIGAPPLRRFRIKP